MANRKQVQEQTRTKDRAVSSTPAINPHSIFISKDAYRHVATDFYPCHSHPINLILHVIGASIQMWGAVQLLIIFNLQLIVYGFMAYVVLSTPISTAILHSMLFWSFINTPLPFESMFSSEEWDPIIRCILAFGCGILKDVGHHIANEKPFMGSYMKDKPYMFFFHATWHLPFLIDAYSPFSTVKMVSTTCCGGRKIAEKN